MPELIKQVENDPIHGMDLAAIRILKPASNFWIRTLRITMIPEG